MVGPDLGFEVLGYVQGDHLDALFRLRDGLLVRITSPDVGSLFLGLLMEDGAAP